MDENEVVAPVEEMPAADAPVEVVEEAAPAETEAMPEAMPEASPEVVAE